MSSVNVTPPSRVIVRGIVLGAEAPDAGGGLQVLRPSYAIFDVVALSVHGQLAVGAGDAEARFDGKDALLEPLPDAALEADGGKARGIGSIRPPASLPLFAAGAAATAGTGRARCLHPGGHRPVAHKALGLEEPSVSHDRPSGASWLCGPVRVSRLHEPGRLAHHDECAVRR
jgi:hypothetical protein